MPSKVISYFYKFDWNFLEKSESFCHLYLVLKVDFSKVSCIIYSKKILLKILFTSYVKNT